VRDARRHAAAGASQAPARARLPRLDAMPGIAGPQLVAAVARQRNRHALARRRGDVVGRNRRRIAERLVEVPRQPRQQLVNLRLDHRRVEPAPEVRRDPLRLVDLVERLVRESDRGREHRRIARLRHVGDDRRRIDAAREERAQGHLADEAHPDRFGQERIQFLDVPRFIVRVAVTGEFQIPVLRHPHRVAIGDEHVPRRQLLDVPVDRVGAGHVEEGEIGVDRFRRPRPIDRRIFEERLDLRAEHEPAAAQLRVVDRLDADAIACEQQALPARIPDREREHAAEAFDAGIAPLLVPVDDHLGVGMGAEPVARALQLRAQVREVVDLAVERHPDAAVLVRQRLLTRGDVDDAQPAMREADALAHVVPVGVGAPVRDGVRHRRQQLTIDRRLCRGREFSSETTHREPGLRDYEVASSGLGSPSKARSSSAVR
jgi:hypothetical protein